MVQSIKPLSICDLPPFTPQNPPSPHFALSYTIMTETPYIQFSQNTVTFSAGSQYGSYRLKGPYFDRTFDAAGVYEITGKVESFRGLPVEGGGVLFQVVGTVTFTPSEPVSVTGPDVNDFLSIDGATSLKVGQAKAVYG